MMSTIARGNAGEAAVLNAFVQGGFQVFVPFGSGHAADLAILIEDTFVRVQCKTGWKERGCLLFNSYSTDHGRGPGTYQGLVEVFGVFFPPTGSVYLVPVSAVTMSGGRLRLEPPRNNQRRRIRHAEVYEFARWSGSRLKALVTGGDDDRVPFDASVA